MRDFENPDCCSKISYWVCLSFLYLNLFETTTLLWLYFLSDLQILIAFPFWLLSWAWLFPFSPDCLLKKHIKIDWSKLAWSIYFVICGSGFGFYCSQLHYSQEINKTITLIILLFPIFILSIVGINLVLTSRTNRIIDVQKIDV